MRLNRLQIGAAIACFAAAGCVSAPAPTPTPAPAPAPQPQVQAPAPVPVYNSWMDIPATPGDWTYRTGTALFSDPAGGALLALRCNRGGGAVEITRAGQAGSPEMIVRTETMDRSIAARPSAAGITAQVPARDPLLDAMAFSKGRFAVEVTGLQPIYPPAWPEVTRVIEDCR